MLSIVCSISAYAFVPRSLEQEIKQGLGIVLSKFETAGNGDIVAGLKQTIEEKLADVEKHVAKTQMHVVDVAIGLPLFTGLSIIAKYSNVYFDVLGELSTENVTGLLAGGTRPEEVSLLMKFYNEIIEPYKTTYVTLLASLAPLFASLAEPFEDAAKNMSQIANQEFQRQVAQKFIQSLKNIKQTIFNAIDAHSAQIREMATKLRQLVPATVAVPSKATEITDLREATVQPVAQQPKKIEVEQKGAGLLDPRFEGYGIGDIEPEYTEADVQNK